MIGLEETMYSVDEGSAAVEVCAVLPGGPAERRVEADVNTQAVTAQGKDNVFTQI